MRVTKRILTVILVLAITLSMFGIQSYASEKIISSDALCIKELSPTEKVSESSDTVLLSNNSGNNYAFITFEFDGIDITEIGKATLNFYMSVNKGSRKYTVSVVTNEWNQETGEYTLDESTALRGNSCGWMKSLRSVDITSLIKNYNNNRITLCIQHEGSFAETSDGYVQLWKSGTDAPYIDLDLDTPPTISEYYIGGTLIEGFDITAHYIFSSALHSEKDSVIDWLCADDTSGENETNLLLDGGKSFTLNNDCVGKYIRARIIPYADNGLYVKGGREHSNIYYTDYIGPIESVTYLDEIASKISEECANTIDLYGYLSDNESLFNLGIDKINSEPYNTYREQILGNVLDAAPQNYIELNTVYNNEMLTIDIQEAEVSVLADVLEQATFDLSVYNSLLDKSFFENALSADTFLSYDDLTKSFDKICIASLIIEETSSEKLPELINNCSKYLSIDLSNYSYGELLEASKYIVSADKSSIEDFDEFDILLTDALIYGEDNYVGGFLTSKKFFSGEAYIKTDYTNDIRGINSIVPAETSYSLYGNTNSSNYRQYAFLKLDISDLLSYDIYSAKINMYGSVNGGADKTIEIAESDVFDNSEDWVLRYPYGTDIVKGPSLGGMKFSYGKKKWNTVDVTDFILQKKNQGENEVYLIIDYTDAAVGIDVSKQGLIWSQSKGEEFAPYIEIVYETPPIVKNLEIKGVKSVGNTLSAEYDFYGCNEEKNSVFEWYSANKSGSEYSNEQLILGENTSSLTIGSNLAGKCIMVKVKPKTEVGRYTEGEYYSSEYTVPILNTSEDEILVGQINSVQSVDALISLLSNNENKQYLDIDVNKDMESLSDSTKVKNILVEKDFDNLKSFTEYFRNMIDVQHINETSFDELEDAVMDCNILIPLERYKNFEDKTSIHNAIYNKGFNSVEEFTKSFNETCAIYEFDSVNHSNVTELIKAYDFMFTQDISAYDESKLGLIGNMFMTTIQGKKASFSLIQQALTEAVNKADNYTPEIDKKPTYSGGGGTGGSSSVSVPATSGGSHNITPVTPDKVFNDIDSVESWAGKQILKLYELGVVSGDGSGAFRPNDSITREEFVKIIVTAFGIESEGKSEFADVDENAWYSKYIDKAVSAGIVNGIGNGEFGVGKNISREDMAVILYRVLLSKNIVAEKNAYISFIDTDEISTYAYIAVSTLTQEGVLNGIGENKFAPKSTATRAMISVMICNALELK